MFKTKLYKELSKSSYENNSKKDKSKLIKGIIEHGFRNWMYIRGYPNPGSDKVNNKLNQKFIHTSMTDDEFFQKLYEYRKNITHYTYEISNINSGMKYIGVRSCEGKPDIGVKYFSSSKFKPHFQKNKKDFLFKVLQEFDNVKDAREHEGYLQHKFEVADNPMYYNLANNGPNRKYYKEKPEVKLDKLMRIKITRLPDIDIASMIWRTPIRKN